MIDPREMAALIERHREPHTCQREGPWAACDFNRYGHPAMRKAASLSTPADETPKEPAP